MKDSKLPQTEVAPIKTKKHHSFRNIMLLILFALGIWSWFNYLPQHAMDTLTMLHDRAGTQINTWLGIAPSEPVDYSLMLPPQAVPTTSGEIILNGEVTTGDSQTDTGSNTVSVGRSADNQTGSVTTGDVTSGTTVWDEVDTINEPVGVSEPATAPSTSTNTGSVMSISIGGQTITVDGTPDEDIIINGNGYTITVQKN